MITIASHIFYPLLIPIVASLINLHSESYLLLHLNEISDAFACIVIHWL